LNKIPSAMRVNMAKIQTIESKVVYQNAWMTVKEDRVRRPSGSEGIYGIVEKPDFVVIIPVDNGYVHLVEQYRYPVKDRHKEFPQGSYETNRDDNHTDSAIRELREETGLIAHEITHIGSQYLAYGYSNQAYHIYLATNLEQNSSCLDQEEEDLTTEKIPLETLEKMILSGEIMDATTVNAFGLARLKNKI